MASVQIMVVEDERIVALHLRRQLQKLGYDVVFVASSGEQVLRQIDTIHPDIILMDIHIEGELDGIETVSQLPEDAHIPVIYLTAYSEEAVLMRARATKPFGFLLKPFSERELHATIQMAMERRQVEMALRDSEEHLALALESAGMGAWEVDVGTRQILRAGRTSQVLGCWESRLSGSWDGFLNHVLSDDRVLLLDVYEQLLQENASCQVEFRGVCPDGSIRWLKAQGKSIPAQAERPQRIIGVMQDITEQKAADDRRRQALTAFETTRDGLLILDRDLRIVTANPGYCDMVGRPETALLGRRPCFFEVDSSVDFSRALADGARWRGEIQGVRDTGNLFPLLVNIAAVRNDVDQISHYVAALTDLSAIRKAEAELEHLAHFDPLTDLPNRLLANDRLDHAMERSRRSHHLVGVMFVDLDFFKRINDTLGHSVGDRVLQVVAQRMRAAVRVEDTVARLGGDEFMVVMEQVSDPNDLALIALKLIEAVAAPILFEDRELTTSASIGISLYPGDGQTRESLLQAADTAMYAAKEMGRNSYAFYTTEMTNRVIHAVAMDQELHRGLQREELRLFYQPQMSVETGAVIGVEALIRWRHPTRGLLGAGEVVPVAERSGFIVDIGDWAILDACRQASAWLKAGLPRMRIAVNASAQQMRKGRLLQAVSRALQETGLPPQDLEIEITESMLQNEEECLSTLHELRRLGVGLAIDDFGTGYSCLSSLKTLPIERLKIDQAFTRGIPGDSNDVAIAETIVAIAHRLKLEVMAEGVENKAQEDFLRRQGCEGAQGFLYARPLPAADIADFAYRHAKRV